MAKVTLCYLVKKLPHTKHVLLAPKKRVVCIGKMCGYGGHIEDGETSRQAAVRENRQESTVIVDESDLIYAALIRFYRGGKLKFECDVYLTYDWQGEAVETDEMGAPHWYPVTGLPFNDMMPGDVKWLPLILADQTGIGDVYYNDDNTELLDFTWTPTDFHV